MKSIWMSDTDVPRLGLIIFTEKLSRICVRWTGLFSSDLRRLVARLFVKTLNLALLFVAESPILNHLPKRQMKITTRMADIFKYIFICEAHQNNQRGNVLC